MKTEVVDVARLVGGPEAQDKDIARRIRTEYVLPTLADAGRYLVLDFSRVSMATQSFIHACISEAFRKHSDEAGERLEFKGCALDVRNLITTVVDYSTLAADFIRVDPVTKRKPAVRLTSSDVPQSDNLDRVRDVIEALARGDNTHEQIAKSTGYSRRHVDYRLHAARILGFIEMNLKSIRMAPRGHALLRTERDSDEERHMLGSAVEESPILQKLVPDLLDDEDPPPAVEIARRIMRRTGLGPSTAARRARTLMSWRKRICRSPQLDLFPEPEEPEANEE